MSKTRQYGYLTQEDVDHFMENGYIIIKEAFTEDKAQEWTKTMWVRLDLDPHDKSTWSRERVHMPWHKRELVSEFAPKAWEAMKDLLGGAERIDENTSSWGDSFILNFGTPELEHVTEDTKPEDLDNWHVDGDFFVHFLDSPEQAMLVIPIFAPIAPRGGGTMISPDGLEFVAQYLAAHPEGVLPTGRSFTPTTVVGEPQNDPGYWSTLEEIKRCKKFVELTGDVGDVVLMHPLMLHSASKNYTRSLRVITNPPVALKEPFNYDRGNPEEYSLVEKKTLKALGVDRLRDWKITSERRRLTPARVGAQAKLLEEEKQRVAAWQAKQFDRSAVSVLPEPITVV